jgi:hypothetical protein
LFDDHRRQITTHFLRPNPDEDGTLRPTWQHSRDTSAVWAQAAQTSSDHEFVVPDAIPWLLLRVAGDEEGRRGTRAFDDLRRDDGRRREFVPYAAAE